MADHDWIGPTLERLAGLIMMPGRNNSYNCAKVSPATAHSAMETLMRHMGPHTPPPRIMPTENGGLTFEWHEKDVDIVFTANGPLPAAGSGDAVSAEEWHRELEVRFAKIDALYMEPKA